MSISRLAQGIISLCIVVAIIPTFAQTTGFVEVPFELGDMVTRDVGSGAITGGHNGILTGVISYIDGVVKSEEYVINLLTSDGTTAFITEETLSEFENVGGQTNPIWGVRTLGDDATDTVRKKVIRLAREWLPITTIRYSGGSSPLGAGSSLYPTILNFRRKLPNLATGLYPVDPAHPDWPEYPVFRSDGFTEYVYEKAMVRNGVGITDGEDHPLTNFSAQKQWDAMLDRLTVLPRIPVWEIVDVHKWALNPGNNSSPFYLRAHDYSKDASGIRAFEIEQIQTAPNQSTTPTITKDYGSNPVEYGSAGYATLGWAIEENLGDLSDGVYRVRVWDGAGNMSEQNITIEQRLNIRINGTVARPSGNLLQKAVVRIYWQGNYLTTAKTGIGLSTGKWSTDHIDPVVAITAGHYHLLEMYDGYGPQLIDVGQLNPGETRTLNINLPAEGKVSGVVRRSTDNAPIDGATVEAWYDIPAINESIKLSKAITDGNGNYSLGSLPNNQVRIKYHHDKYAELENSVAAVSGQTINHDILLVPMPGSLEIIVERDLDGTRLDNTSVTATATNLFAGTDYQSTFTGSTSGGGQFLISNVGPALYSITASLSGYFSETSPNNQVMPAETKTIVIKLVKKAKLTAQVVDASNQPIPGVAVTFTGTSGGNYPSQTLNLTTDAQGWFQVEGLPPGSYAITLDKSSENYAPKTVTVTLGDGEAKMDQYVLLKLGVIEGTVTRANATNDAVPNVTVTVAGPVTKMNATDAQGHYRIEALLAGNYAVSVTAQGYVTPSSQNATAVNGQITPVNFVLQKLGSLSGNVQSTTGSAISGATIMISGAITKTATSDGSGHFNFDELPPGVYSISTTANGYALQSGSKDVPEGGQATVTIVMQAVGKITGVVSSSTGGGVGGAIVSAGSYSTTTAGNGSYTLENIPHGNYTVTASAPGYTGGSPVNVTVSATNATANFTLNPQPCGINVTANVSASFSLSGPSGGSATGTSHDFYPLPPGSYSITAFANGYQSQTQSVGISPGQHPTINFNLQPNQGKGTIRVTVRKINKKGDEVCAQNTYVQVSGPVTAGHNTNFSGVATFSDLPLGSYSVSCQYGSGSVQLTIDGQIVNIQLGP
ncbi:MAG: hypothetical protein COS94_04960 [Candidatus Hydrogenedentes bacterium CG07_land_8_20_14_0_80_42_17]|nr:MAG: hypothetical protein COS94_04960 [Candidatus Hydrogenedentes bacterium CG07_land_8_20_14_0_80_42_17]